MIHDPDDMLLQNMATMAFSLGLEHGRKHSRPIDSEALMHELRSTHHYKQEIEWRVIHRAKLRQVYGAGFDISSIIRKHSLPTGKLNA